MTPHDKALKTLFHNWKSVKNSTKIGIPPSDNHYVHNYYWDSCFIAIVLSYFDKTSLAKMQIQAVLKGQYPNGFIPNMNFGRGRFLDPERFLFRNYFKSSDYSQPPLLAHAVYETYKKMRSDSKKEAISFLKKVYLQTKKHYLFWKRERHYKKTHLIMCIHPHETGRDSDPLFDIMYKKHKIEKNIPFKNLFNTAIDYFYALIYTLSVRQHKRNLEFCDVMVNCIYAQNLVYLASIARELKLFSDKKIFEDEAKKVEKDIFSYMYSKKERVFCALYKGLQVPYISIACIFPLLLKTITKKHIKEILSLLDSKEYFNTPFPLSTVPVKSSFFDATYKEKRLWRGPVWININWYVVEALFQIYKQHMKIDRKTAKQAYSLAFHISTKTQEMIQQGCFEFYNPFSGKGMRVDHFSWSTLGFILEDYVQRGIFFKKVR